MLFITALATVSSLQARDSLRPALKLRGGLAGVDADLAAKSVLALSALNGGYLTLAPKPASEAYGMKSATEMQVSMIESMGALTLGMAIAGFFALSGAEPAKVTAYALILPLVNTAKWLLNGTGKKLGMPDHGQYINGGIMAVAMYCLLTGTGDADVILKAVAAWWGFNGLVAFSAPDKLAGAYGLETMDSDLTALMQSLGSFLLNFAVFTYLYSTGTPAAQAVGQSCVPGLICVLDQQFGRKMSVASLDANTQIFWVAVMAAAIGFTNF
jgi:hypothetical protein